MGSLSNPVAEWVVLDDQQVSVKVTEDTKFDFICYILYQGVQILSVVCNRGGGDWRPAEIVAKTSTCGMSVQAAERFAVCLTEAIRIANDLDVKNGNV